MGEGKTQRSAGWYAGACVFWLLAAWLVIVGVGSLVPQIFPSGSVRPRHGSSCAEDLRDLRDELLNRAGDQLKAARSAGTRDTLQSFFGDFDRRLMRTKLSCSEREQTAFQELLRLRHSLAGLLERFQREQGPHIRKLQVLLDEPSTLGAATP